MTDWAIMVDDQQRVGFTLTKGNFAYVKEPYSDNTTLQRASLAMFIEAASIPGLPDTGNNWAGYLAKTTNYVDLSTSIQTHIGAFVGTTANEGYYPLMFEDPDSPGKLRVALVSPSVVEDNV